MGDRFKAVVVAKPGAQHKGQKQQIPGEALLSTIEFNENGLTQGGKRI